MGKLKEGNSPISQLKFCGLPHRKLPGSRIMGPTASSLILEAILYFNRVFMLLYLLVGYIVFIYKGLILPYPTVTIVGEMILLAVVCGIDVCRIFLASRGNKTEKLSPLIFSVILFCSPRWGMCTLCDFKCMCCEWNSLPTS